METTDADDGASEDPAPADTAAPETTAAAEPAAEAPPPEVGEMGSFTVNGVEYAVNVLNRCIPFSESDDDIDLQALAQGQGAKINLVMNGDWPDLSVDGTDLEDRFGSRAYGTDSPAESTISGDRWTGSATMDDAYGTGDTVDVTWDVQIPDEVRDCSL